MNQYIPEHIGGYLINEIRVLQETGDDMHHPLRQTISMAKLAASLCVVALAAMISQVAVRAFRFARIHVPDAISA